MLEIKNLYVSVENNEIIKGVSLNIKPGEIHILMGPNGSGKSSLALALAGHPRYQITSGKLNLLRKNITKLTADKRAKLGLFIALQHPVAIPGVSVANFLRSSQKALKVNSKFDNFIAILKEKMSEIKLGESFIYRAVHDGFSGGEKKKLEIVQLEILKPKYAILDEPDSGLDVDALKLVASKIENTAKSNTAIILITHNPKILKYIKPNFVHIMISGQIVKSGNYKLAEEIEEKGYQAIKV